MSTTGSYPLAAASAELECLERLVAARTVIDAVLEGRWALDAKVIASLGHLLGAAAHWARLAEDHAAAA